MTKHVQCPHCGQAYALTADQVPRFIGQDITCAQCNESFLVSPDTAVTGGLATAPTTFQTRPFATAGAFSTPALAGANIGIRTGVGTGVSSYAPPISHSRPSPPISNEEDLDESNGFATASVIAAVVGLVVPVMPGLLAIVLGLAGLRRAKETRFGAGFALTGIVVGFIGMLATGGVLLNYVVPRLSSGSTISHESRCADNLHAIGVAMLQYAHANAGQFPDRVESIVESRMLSPELLVCPSTSDTIARGQTPHEQAVNLAKGQHVSYIYTGAGLSSRATPESVLMYEPIGRHGEGMQVLFCDGRVETIGKVEAMKAVTRLAGGMNPPWTRTK